MMSDGAADVGDDQGSSRPKGFDHDLAERLLERGLNDGVHRGHEGHGVTSPAEEPNDVSEPRA